MNADLTAALADADSISRVCDCEASRWVYCEHDAAGAP